MILFDYRSIMIEAETIPFLMRLLWVPSLQFWGNIQFPWWAPLVNNTTGPHMSQLLSSLGCLNRLLGGGQLHPLCLGLCHPRCIIIPTCHHLAPSSGKWALEWWHTQVRACHHLHQRCPPRMDLITFNSIHPPILSRPKNVFKVSWLLQRWGLRR